MKKSIRIVIVLIFIFIQVYFNLNVSTNFVATILTVLSIFFGFYLTSFAVFANAKYLSFLYKIEDKNDNSMTLLDALLKNFKSSYYLLLYFILYFLILYVLIDNKVSFVLWLKYPIWAIIFYAFYTLYHSIADFIRIVRQNAIDRE